MNQSKATIKYFKSQLTPEDVETLKILNKKKKMASRF